MGILDIFNEHLVLRLRIIVYGVLIFFSFFIFVGAAVMKDENNGHCPLYAERGKGYPPQANCNYPMAISIIFQLLYLLGRIVCLLLLMLGKFNTELFLFSDMFELIYVAVDLVAFFLTFIGACILSAGYNATCNDFTCGGDWASACKAAQAGAWISTFAWLFIGVAGFLCLWRAGKIPFLSGGGAASTGATGAAPDDKAPPMETPPNNPDDEPRY